MGTMDSGVVTKPTPGSWCVTSQSWSVPSQSWRPPRQDQGESGVTLDGVRPVTVGGLGSGEIGPEGPIPNSINPGLVGLDLFLGRRRRRGASEGHGRDPLTGPET